MRSKSGRKGDEPFEEILDATVLVQLLEKGDRVGTVEPSTQDEERKNAAPDLPTGYGCVGAGELPNLDLRERRPAVSVAGPFFSNS